MPPQPSPVEVKPASRFATVFKLARPTRPAAPPPPPKDGSLNPFYGRPLFSRSAADLVLSPSPDSVSAPSACLEFGRPLPSTTARTAASSPAPSASALSLGSLARSARDNLHSPSMDGSTDSSGSSPSANLGVYILDTASPVPPPTAPSARSKKGVFKLANLAKRNRSRRDLSDAASASGSVGRSASVSDYEAVPAKQDGDEGISMPWNFQHNIHVDEGYIGLPPSWSAALAQAGFDDDEIAAIHARRRVAATAVPTHPKLAASPTERPTSPRTLVVASASSSATLLDPVPRSSSLRKGREALRLNLPPTESVLTSVGDGPPSIAEASLAPSPRAPSFSMRSFVSGIKSSLASDSPGTGRARAGGGASGEESEQYILVDGNGPDDVADQGMPDETLIEPYPFDASRAQPASQGQHTPRTSTFPQIHIQRAQSAGHVQFPSSAARAPSPLAHSTSLPTPTPPRGHTHSDRSAPSSPSQSIVVPAFPPAPPSTQTPTRRIYHVSNASSDESYSEPPPAYVPPKKGEWTQKNEKEGFQASNRLPPPDRPIPSVPTQQLLGEPSGASTCDDGKEEDTSGDTAVPADDIPGTADEVMDISSYYSDNVDGEAEGVSSPTPPLVIDKRTTKLATLPPRISFHQEGSLEDWSESLFSVIGNKGKRSSVLLRSTGGDATTVKQERRTTLRPMTPLSTTQDLATSPSSVVPETVAPSLPDISFGANLTLGPHPRGSMDVVAEGDEQEQVMEDNAEERRESDPEEDPKGQAVDVDLTAVEEAREVDKPLVSPLTPPPSDVSPGLDMSSPGENHDPPTPRSAPLAPLLRISVDSVPPSPPPKHKPTPILPPPIAILAPPRTNIITGVSGRSPVNTLFGSKPQPLPIPISPSQIRAQLRPAPPKPPYPPPMLPLPPLKRATPQPSPVPSPQKTPKYNCIPSHPSSSEPRPSSSQTLVPVVRVNGDRDSGMSTVTVTPATITMAKTEVVRTATASVIESDAVSLASRRASAVPTAGAESQTLGYERPDAGEESPRTQEHGEAPDDSVISETSSVSLLRNDSQSKWPAPPPPPVDLEADSTPRRMSRFRTTSLGRVSHLQAMGGAVASPICSHFSHGSSETTSSEGTPLATPKGVNGVSPLTVPKVKGGLAPEARMLSSITDTFGGVDGECEDEEEREEPSEVPTSELDTSIWPFTHPLLAQLQPYIVPCNPTSCFKDLVEIAEGETGSVFAARVVSTCADSRSHRESTERPTSLGASHVAIKRIPLPPTTSSPSLSDDTPVSSKLVSVLHELSLLKDLDHEHLLLLDAVYVGPNSSRGEDGEPASTVDTSLWIRMELMERSLADVIGLVAEGLALQERLVARFASDILHGLDYLQRQHIAHRDVRSDNLLVNSAGVVKLGDFSNAVCVDRNAPSVSGAVGVIYWQAPEMRTGSYNALKVDIWSLGATVWELAETVPPFSMPASPSTDTSFAIQTTRHVGSQWPPLTHPEHYSRAFHEFLKLCGKEAAGRPGPAELLSTSFIRNACGRAVILQLLSQCRAIEETMAAKEADMGDS